MQVPHRRNRSWHFVLIVLVATLGYAGCRSSQIWAEDEWESLYDPDRPNFDLQVIPSWHEGRFGADVSVAIPAASLTYVRRGTEFTGGFDLLVRVFDRRERLLSESAHSDTLVFDHSEATVEYEPTFWEQRLEVDRGVNIVQVVLVDAGGGRQSSQAVRVEIPEPSDAYLGEPVLEGIEPSGRTRPFLSPLIPSSTDSLRATVQYATGRPDPVDITFRLFRVARDTSAAVPPYWVSPGFGTLQFRGLAPQEVDTVQTAARRIEAVEGAAAVSFNLPPLDEGVYRLEIEANSAIGSTSSRARFITITPEGFPRVETLGQMVDALHYIAYESEIGRIRAGGSLYEKRARFDSFWGSLVPRRTVAANLLESYYSRIEEANLRYSSYKEGWKTDRGMIFVLLGAPLRVDGRGDTEVWRYSFSDDATYTFVFDRVAVPEAGGRFDNFVLRRRPHYEHVWAQAMDRWRRGIIL